MREPSDEYRNAVTGCTRHIGFRCSLQGERSFYTSEILEINIARAISDGFQIGACGSDRLRLVTKATDRVEKGARIIAYAYPGSDINNTESLGVFYADEVSTENGATTIIAYDKMNRNLDKVVRWTGTGAPSFPAAQQDLLDYICDLKSINCAFVCQPFVVQEKPVGYTAREIIGFIAACHAANAHFNADGELIFKQFTQTSAKIDRLRCYSHTIAGDSGFTVNGVLFDTGADTQIYIDGDASEYDEEAEGIVEVFCPFATIEVAEYVWHNLGGLTYCSCSIDMPAEDLLEVGDVYTTTDASGQAVQSIVIEQELSVSVGDGFKEALSAAAESSENQRSTAQRVDALESRLSESSSTGALTSYEILSDTEVACDGITYTAEFDSGSGLISRISDSTGANIVPDVSAGITNISLHNAVFFAVAIAKGIARGVGDTMPNMRGMHAYFDYKLTQPAGSLWANYISGGSPMQLFGGAGSVSAINTGSCLRFEGAEQQYGLYDFDSVSDLTIYYIMRSQPVVSSKNITAGGIASLSKTNQSEINFWSYTDRVVVGTYGNVDQTALKSKTFEDGFSVIAVRKLSGVLGCFCDGEYKGNRNQSKDLKPRLTIGGYERVGTMIWLPSGSTDWQYAGPTEVLFVALSSAAHTDSEIIENMNFLKRRFNIV